MDKINLGSPDLRNFVKELWPTLNKIQKGIELMMNTDINPSDSQQTILLSITSENIGRIYDLIDFTLLQERKYENFEYQVIRDYEIDTEG